MLDIPNEEQPVIALPRSVHRFHKAQEVRRTAQGEETKVSTNETALAPEEASDTEIPGAQPHEAGRRVLIVEDNATARRQIEVFLEADPEISVDSVANGADALKAIRERAYSVIVTDLKMPQLDGLQLLAEVHKSEEPAAVIITTGYGTIDDAVSAMRLGAADFLTKPINLEHLRLLVQRALRDRALRDEVAALRRKLLEQFSFENILSKSPRMHDVFELISHVAQTNSTVLIDGETGTGKELVARAVHSASPRRGSPFVAVNCAALPESLLESELFGHEKGAFTSAIGQRKGRFELAHGGTIFLDEVGEIPASMQAKLLRVLQERRFERVGGTQTIEVDVRVVAATNRDLLRLAKEGKFREDLYYRLNVVKIDLPPLRERAEDIPLLATHFVRRFSPQGSAPKLICPEAMEALLQHRWPGNIRELENAIERACVTSRDDIVRPENLPGEILNLPRPGYHIPVDLGRPMAEQIAELTAAFEERYLRRALRKTRGHIGRTAQIMGLSRRTITDKIAHYGIDKSEFKRE
jgi:two-component system response regulator AtoC